MRTTRLVVVLLLTAALAAGCDEDGAGPPLLLVGTHVGLAVLDTATGVLGPAASAVTNPGGELLVRADLMGTRTQLREIDVADGTDAWAATIEGTYETRVVSAEGDRVALVSPPGPWAEGALAAGRASTEIVVVHEEGPADSYQLEGNIEPEAFALDGTALFVISYQPPEAPTSYQVRRLDLGTGVLGDVFSVDADLQETMQGTARTQAWDPDGDRLYTLYSFVGANGSLQSFVHVLDLDEQWAHCVHLPGVLSLANAGMALAEGGHHLFVADAGGTLYEVDTVELVAERTGSIVAAPDAPTMSVATGPDALYVGAGPSVSTIDRETLEPTATLDVGETVLGLQRSRSTDELFVATPSRVIAYDPVDGTLLREWPIDPNVGVVSLGGRTIPGYVGVQCAC